MLRKSQNRPLTPKDMGISTEYQGMTTELIVDGKVLEQNLAQNHLTKEWLLENLKSRGIDNTGEVFYAELDTNGNLYVDTRDDRGYQQRIEDFPR